MTFMLYVPRAIKTSLLSPITGEHALKKSITVNPMVLERGGYMLPVRLALWRGADFVNGQVCAVVFLFLAQSQSHANFE
jgi:hypothetical protein